MAKATGEVDVRKRTLLVDLAGLMDRETQESEVKRSQISTERLKTFRNEQHECAVQPKHNHSHPTRKFDAIGQPGALAAPWSGIRQDT